MKHRIAAALLALLLCLLTACSRTATRPEERTAATVPTEAVTQTFTVAVPSTAAASTAAESQTQTVATTITITTVPGTTAAAATAATATTAATASTPAAPTTAGSTTAKPSTTKRVYTTTAFRPKAKPTTAPATTVPATTGGKTTEREPSEGGTCTVSITCKVLVNHPDLLKPGKAQFVPTGGQILAPKALSFSAGEDAYTLLRRACDTGMCADQCQYCQKDGIQMEAAYTPGYDTYYVQGIHQLYEKDAGGSSGWKYYVNGWEANVGSSQYYPQDGDVIEWVYVLTP